MFIRTRDSHFRSMVKAASWRITGSIDTFVLSFIFTGSVKVAGSIAGAVAITAETGPSRSTERHEIGAALCGAAPILCV